MHPGSGQTHPDELWSSGAERSADAVRLHNAGGIANVAMARGKKIHIF